jgi:hypothetical protein
LNFHEYIIINKIWPVLPASLLPRKSEILEKMSSRPVMNEVEALHRRRQYLLEQIGKAADEINRIDGRLAYLISPTFDVDLPMVKSEY